MYRLHLLVKQIQHQVQQGNPNVQVYEGVDLERMSSYKVYRVEGLQEPRLGKRLLGIKVELTYLKGKRKGQTEQHYALTSAVYLNCQDIWEIRKGHWRIETLFKSLKGEFWSSHSYMEGAHEAQVLASLVCLSFNLKQLYDWIEQEEVKGSQQNFRKLKLTLKQGCLFLYRSLILWATGLEE